MLVTLPIWGVNFQPRGCLPTSVALPFGVLEKVFVETINKVSNKSA